jgi:hypothetical protein
MRNNRLSLLAIVLVCAAACGKTAAGQDLVFQNFPERKDVGILCWSIPDQGAGYLSQIIVFETDRRGISRLLWQSALDNSYSPRIRFIPEVRAQGLPVALVERQTGASSSELDVIGRSGGHIASLIEIDGFKFDTTPLDGSKLPFIVAHRDASILDVPSIYRWNGSRFVEDSASHPGYYRELLADDKTKLPAGPSPAVLVNLSRIAVLSGDRATAKKILDEALANERSKGRQANPEALQLIGKALRDLARTSR